MDTGTAQAFDEQLHAPGQSSHAAEGLTVDEVCPAADGLTQQQADHSHVHQGGHGDLLAAGIEECHNGTGNDGAINGHTAVPDSDHAVPLQGTGLSAPIQIQIEQHIVNTGTDDTAGDTPQHQIHHMVFFQTVTLGLLHSEVHTGQHGHGQNDAVPVNAIAHINGDGIGIELPVREQSGELDGHVCHCFQGRFFLSFSSNQSSLGRISERTEFSSVIFSLRNAATSSMVMESNTWGKRNGS